MASDRLSRRARASPFIRAAGSHRASRAQGSQSTGRSARTRCLWAIILAVVVLASCTSDSDSDDGSGKKKKKTKTQEPRLSWILPPAGPETPSVNEDSAYRGLAAGRDSCRAMLDDGFFSEPPPGGFVTGNRTYFLFKAGAHLCAGSRSAGRAAFAQALEAEWVEPTGPIVRSRVCNVWDAVTRILDPAKTGHCLIRIVEDGDDTSAATSDQPSDDVSETISPSPSA
jgi:hypothetical protein